MEFGSLCPLVIGRTKGARASNAGTLCRTETGQRKGRLRLRGRPRTTPFERTPRRAQRCSFHYGNQDSETRVVLHAAPVSPIRGTGAHRAPGETAAKRPPRPWNRATALCRTSPARLFACSACACPGPRLVLGPQSGRFPGMGGSRCQNNLGSAAQTIPRAPGCAWQMTDSRQ